MWRVFASLLLCLSFGLTFTHVQAVSVSPESVTLEVAPGEKVYQTLYFENNNSKAQNFIITLYGLAFGSSADELIFEALDADKRTWITLSQEDFKLEPDQAQAVEMTIAVPNEAETSVLSFAVIAEEVGDTSDGIGITSGAGSLIFVNIGGGPGSNLSITDFEPVPANRHHLPLRFAALLTNQGAGLSQPEVGIVIKNMWGQETDLISLNPTARRVPGYTDRVFSEEWAGSPWRFGAYTAELYVFPDDSDAVLTASTNVVLFPWQMLCVFVLVGLFLVVTGTLIFKARRR